MNIQGIVYINHFAEGHPIQYEDMVQDRRLCTQFIELYMSSLGEYIVNITKKLSLITYGDVNLMHEIYTYFFVEI